MTAAADGILEVLWILALSSSHDIRGGAWGTELTGLLRLSGWPAGMYPIVRKERPHPGATLRAIYHDGLRLTAFVTSTTVGNLQTLDSRQPVFRKNLDVRELRRALSGLLTTDG